MDYPTIRSAKTARAFYVVLTNVLITCSIFLENAQLIPIVILSLTLQYDAHKSMEILRLKEQINSLIS